MKRGRAARQSRWAGGSPAPAEVAAAWERALSAWGVGIQVEAPTLDPKAPAIAYIDLETRKVVVNPATVAGLGAEDSLEAILAHELGHHLRYPGSLATQARLELFERELLPVRAYSLLNLFSDFLINTELAREHRHLKDQLAAVYAGMDVGPDQVGSDPAFFFYLTCFEEAWLVPPNSLTKEAGAELERRYPGARAEAQVLAQEMPNLAPNLFTQFVYFASVVSRYQVVDAEKEQYARGRPLNPSHGDHSAPTAGDYADALRRGAQESEAIRRAIDEGWLKPEAIPDKAGSERIRAGALPGVLAGEPKKLAEAMALHYRRLAEPYLLKPPPLQRGGEPVVPSTLSPWEVGDSPKEIDWIASITAAGADLGVAQPLKRDWIEDDPSEEPQRASVRLEIYLDVSGSMPDPKSAVNPMTLAAQVLAMSAIRNGGQVRALIYSTNFLQHWAWTRSEAEVSKFLMSYIGGGTDYPFAVLRDSVKECARNPPVRVVLTDSDYLYNLKTLPRNAKAVVEAAAQSPYVVLLNGFQNSRGEQVSSVIATGAAVVPVASMEKFPAVAAALGEALFGKDAAAARRATGGRA